MGAPIQLCRNTCVTGVDINHLTYTIPAWRAAQESGNMGGEGEGSAWSLSFPYIRSRAGRQTVTYVIIIVITWNNIGTMLIMNRQSI